MGSQCRVSFKIKTPYFADIDVSRLQIENKDEKILPEESLSLNPGEKGTINIHFQLFKFDVFNITTHIFQKDEDEGSIPVDGKMYTVSSVADFIFFVLSINASGYFDIIYSRPDAFDIIRKIPPNSVKIESKERNLPKLNRFCSVKNISCNIEINYLGNDSYTSLKEILDNFSSQILNKESSLVKPPTITKSCCDKTILEIKKSVFLLIPDSQRHQKVLKPALEEVIKDLDYKIIPSTFGHDICKICESIKKSEYIIGDFIADNIEDNEILNNVIAFNLGLSVALGKKVIILQEKPHEKRMIDMTGLIKEYVDSEQAQQIIHEILLP